MQEPARIAIDLGAESCLISLLRWKNGNPAIELVHSIPNGPVHRGPSLCWPIAAILTGLEEGLRKAAALALEGIASIAVDGWPVDYVRLTPEGQPLHEPFCDRDERTIHTKVAADAMMRPRDLFARTGALPHRINTVYQLLADPDDHVDPRAPWVLLPEYVLHWLGGSRVAEFSNATHTGLVDLKTGDWDRELFRIFDIPLDAAPPIVRAGAQVGRIKGSLATLDAYRETQLIASASHAAASAIAGIPACLDSTAYIHIYPGTLSLAGTLATAPVTTGEAFAARFTNLGAATGDLCFHAPINGMWLLKQCMKAWSAEGRAWNLEDLIEQAASSSFPGVINVDAEPLLLESDMPERINHQLWRRRWATIPDVAGNEPVFARVIFESLAARYATALDDLERMLDRKMERIHMLGTGGRNKLLVELIARRTGLPVDIGEVESVTIGNFAVQLAANQAGGEALSSDSIRRWAKILCER
jgi:rhamnulokinase